MLDKFKDEAKKYRYWGMTKSDLIRLSFMVGVFIFVFAMIVFVLPGLIPPPPKSGGEGVVLIKPPQRFGDKGSREWLERLKEEKLKRLRSQRPQIPKPKKPFKPDPTLLASVRDDDYVADLKGVVYLLHKLNWERMRLRNGVDVAEAIGEPTKWRGKEVSVSGTLLSLQKQPLRDNPSGLKFVWKANIKTEKGRVLCYFYRKESVFASAEEFEGYEGDKVSMHGLFLQRLREGVGVVVGRTLERVGLGPGQPGEPREPCEKLDRKILSKVKDGASEIDAQAVVHMVWWLNSKLPLEFERWFLPNCWRLDKALENYPKTLFNPVWVDGTLTRLKLRRLPQNLSGVEWLLDGVMQTGVTEEPVRVLFFEQNQDFRLKGEEEGDLLRVKGILLGRVRTEYSGGERVLMPVVVARNLEFIGEKGGSTPPLVPFREDKTIWGKAPIKAEKLWEEGIEYALHYINSMTYEDFISIAEKKAIWIGQAFDSPERNAGKLVWLEGNLTTCAEGPNPSSLSGVNRQLFGQIYCFQTRNNLIWFVCWEKEKDFNTYRGKDSPGDPVRLYGLFVHTWIARYKSGARFEVPVVVGRRLIAAPQHDMFAEFPWVAMLVIGGAIFALMLFFIIRSRQEIRATDEILRKVRTKMAEAAFAKKKKQQKESDTEKGKSNKTDISEQGESGQNSTEKTEK